MPKMNLKANLSVHIVSSINQIDRTEWDGLSAGQHFQSHAWYVFGERVMGDCEPIYILAYLDGKLVGRGSFWVSPNEPLPHYVGYWRLILKPILRKWPLLVCRSPLSNNSGIIFSQDCSGKADIADALIDAAKMQAMKKKCSVLIFDYLSKNVIKDWPAGFSIMEVPEPGTLLRNKWSDFDDYLAHHNKKGRQHYKRTVRMAGNLNIQVKRNLHAENIEEILSLVRNVERQHSAPSNPWTVSMIQNMELIQGILLTATINDRLVACGLLLEDNNAQMATALGLSKKVPYVYLMLVYEGIKLALERKVKLLRWGSGAYDVKRRLGFELEDNGMIAFVPMQPLIYLSNWFLGQYKREIGIS